MDRKPVLVPLPVVVWLVLLAVVTGAAIGLWAGWARDGATPAFLMPKHPSLSQSREVQPEDAIPAMSSARAPAVVGERPSLTPPGRERAGGAGAVRLPDGSAGGDGGGMSAISRTGAGRDRVPPGAEPPAWREASVVPRPAVPGRGPRIAIIIDDWGYDWAAAESFLSFPEPITVAVLPYLPRSVDQALKAREAGFEVILHMPMEALGNGLDIGPGGVYVSMSDEEIAAAVRAALAAVPGARGMNNHMGSLATTDPRVMRAALGVIRELGLFFVDSQTVNNTIAYRVAHELDVPYAVNQVFLDHENDEAFIRDQIRRLMNLALRQGAAVGIGHVRPRTYAALVDMLPEIKAAGIELVPVSQLLTRPASLRRAGGEQTGAVPAVHEDPPQLQPTVPRAQPGAPRAAPDASANNHAPVDATSIDALSGGTATDNSTSLDALPSGTATDSPPIDAPPSGTATDSTPIDAPPNGTANDPANDTTSQDAAFDNTSSDITSSPSAPADDAQVPPAPPVLVEPPALVR